MFPSIISAFRSRIILSLATDSTMRRKLGICVLERLALVVIDHDIGPELRHERGVLRRAHADDQLGVAVVESLTSTKYECVCEGVAIGFEISVALSVESSFQIKDSTLELSVKLSCEVSPKLMVSGVAMAFTFGKVDSTFI